MQAQQAPVTVQAYLQQKKLSASNNPIGVEGTDSMIFDDYGKCKGRGISAWQKARFEHYDQKMRQMKYFEEQKQLQKLKNQKYVEMAKEAENARKQKQLEEEAAIAKAMRDAEKMNRVVVEHTNVDLDAEPTDAW